VYSFVGVTREFGNNMLFSGLLKTHEFAMLSMPCPTGGASDCPCSMMGGVGIVGGIFLLLMGEVVGCCMRGMGCGGGVTYFHRLFKGV
jgi:hypothetical protein